MIERTDLLLGHEAAALTGLTIDSWRKAVQRSPLLRDAKVMIDARTPAYPRHIVEEWARTRPGRGARTDLTTTEETSRP